MSFIFSSGVVKSIGKTLIVDWHVSEMWMPFLTGGLFVLPMLLFTWLLSHLHPPTDADIALRSVRKPMTRQERKSFLSLFLPGIIMIVFTYVLLTVLRDFRDNFANELWIDLGFKDQASIFTKTEIPVSLVVLQLLQSWNGIYPKITNGKTDFIYSPEQGVTIVNKLGGAGMTLSFGLAEEVLSGQAPALKGGERNL